MGGPLEGHPPESLSRPLITKRLPIAAVLHPMLRLLEDAAFSEHPDDSEKQDSADRRDRKTAPETGITNPDCTGDEASQECANDTDKEICEKAVFPAHDLFCDPSGKDANDNRSNDRDFVHEATPFC
jgi:hypothetical protein